MSHVLTVTFEGWSLRTRTIQRPASGLSGGIQMFEIEVKNALDNPDVFHVQLVNSEGHVDREIVFNDRKFARMETLNV